MRGPTINWIERRTGKNVDGSTLPPGTSVRLTSRFHRVDPQQYLIERLVPKPFWRFWGHDTVVVSRLDALAGADGAALGGTFRSDPAWALPLPQNQMGVATFRASSDSRDAVSGTLSSGALILEEMTTSGAMSGQLSAELPLPAVTIGPRLAGSRAYEQRWRVRVADDPPVKLTLIQAEDALGYLRHLEQEVEQELGIPAHEGMHDLPPDTLTYFVDTVADDVALTWQLLADQPMLVTLVVPENVHLRAVACLRLESLEDGSVATSPPRFFTSVRDRLVVTDLTVEMLRPEPRDLLVQLADERFDVDRLAGALSLPATEVWAALTQAAEQLGASSVSDAALLAAENAPVTA
jgi:hypothetical protein